MKLLNQLLMTLTPYGTQSYLVIFGILIACGFGLPMPEDIILVTAGVLASQSIIDLEFTILLTLLGVLIGDGTIFCLGKFFGKSLKTKRPFSWVLSPARDEVVARNIRKYGDKAIFMARFMPGLRTPIFFASGTYQIPFWKFIVFDGIAALVSVPLWVFIGYFFGSNLEKLEKIIHRFQYGIYVVLGAIVLTMGILLFVRNKNAQDTL